MAFDPISASITAGLSLMDMMGKREQSKVSQAQLAETMRMNQEMLRMAKAGQTDAYGNRISFDEALNEWLTKLTPEQQSLISAGEREQRLGLTEDATRNRAIREMQSGVGRQAGDLLSQALTRYGAQGPSEGGTRAGLTRLISQATPEGGPRQEVKPGGAIIRGGFKGGTGTQNLARTLLQSRQGALGETGTREGQRQQRDLGGAGPLSALMAGGQTGINIPNTAGGVDASRNAAMSRLMDAQQSSIKNIQAPYGAMAKTANTMPSLKDIAALYRGFSGGSDKNKPGLGLYESSKGGAGAGNTSGMVEDDDLSSWRNMYNFM